MLRYRLITGPLLILLLVGLVWLDDRIGGPGSAKTMPADAPDASAMPRGLVLLGLATLLLPLAAQEFTRLVRAMQVRTCTPIMITAAWLGLGITLAPSLSRDPRLVVATVMSAPAVLLLAAYVTFAAGRRTDGVLVASGAVMAAFVHLGVLTGFLLLVRESFGAWVLAGVILTTKAGDTGAYFTGRVLGRHKLIPWLSPGKTREGLAGGVVLAAIVGALLARFGTLQLGAEACPWTIPFAAICGAAFALVGQAGDLAMSLLKRGAGVKDSSSLLPGLGGLLDVLDSPLVVAPIAFWLLSAGC